MSMKDVAYPLQQTKKQGTSPIPTGLEQDNMIIVAVTADA